MGLNETLKCPGMDTTLSTYPMEFECPRCGGIVEIWSDEMKRRCTDCNTMVFNPSPSVRIPDSKPEEQAVNTKNTIEALIQLAIGLGSSAATMVDSKDIQIDNQIAELCRETRCPSYGTSPTCPPHIKGPDWLKGYREKTSQAILIEIEVPQELMYSEKRKEIGKLLHFIVIQVEQAAHEKGFTQSTAFAGGSCKKIQCSEHAYCNVLAGDGSCRNPDMSRPSISGFGINMNHLLKSVGWIKKAGDTSTPSSSRYGLVLIG